MSSEHASGIHKTFLLLGSWNLVATSRSSRVTPLRSYWLPSTSDSDFALRTQLPLVEKSPLRHSRSGNHRLQRRSHLTLLPHVESEIFEYGVDGRTHLQKSWTKQKSQQFGHDYIFIYLIVYTYDYLTIHKHMYMIILRRKGYRIRNGLRKAILIGERSENMSGSKRHVRTTKLCL